MNRFSVYGKGNALGRLIFRLIPLVVFVCLIGGCGNPPAPCPTDQQLIDLFNKNKATFTRLLSDPENKALLDQIGIGRVARPDPSAKHASFWFNMWFLDFPGPGGVEKGFVYCEQAPHSLVDSIDDNSKPGSPEEKTLFRHIQGKWYLFYHSIH
jgi:hypothetical protein